MTNPKAVYAGRARRFDEEAARRGRLVRGYGRLRLILFSVTAVGAWLLFTSGRHPWGWLMTGIALLAFFVLIAQHRGARRRLRLAEEMAAFNREGIARLERRWSELPTEPNLPVPDGHPYARDLDLCGEASLLRLMVGGCGTAPGRRTLLSWFLAGANLETIALRQEAVREMAGAADFRDRLAAEAGLLEDTSGRRPPKRGRRRGRPSDSGLDPEPALDEDSFLGWAEGEAWLSRRPWLRAAAVVLPPVNVAAIGLYALGVVPAPAVAWPLLASVLVLMPHWKAVNRVFAQADDGESGVRRYGPLLSHLSEAALESRCATRIRERLGAGGRRAEAEIGALRRLLDLADVRRSPLFHLPLAVILLWDLQVLAALERWKRRSGGHVRNWVRVVGEAEALAALAALASDHPDWAFPELNPKARTLRACALGHPLLPPEVCVRNDVEVGPAGSFLLVTGSNMSGKSTLLKAIGLNVVLGRAGGPVCADSLTFPPLSVVTSMRVQDSVTEGVSFFMAELRRLKQVVDAAEGGGAAEDGDAGTLYLLDEILQGTNSGERQTAARTVIRRLLASGAIGAVTTHDLALADAEDLVVRAVPVYFTESVGSGDEGLSFDYRLRSGVAPSTNALRLLGLVGLGEDHRVP